MAYATVAQLIDRKSSQTIGDLVSDDGSPVLEGDLATNSKVLAALDSASGAIEAAVFAGNRYTAADLAGLVGNSAAYLVSITCDLAMAFLFARKPTHDIDDYKAAMDLQDSHLERLRQGKHVFNVAEVEAAGVPSVALPSVVQVTGLNLIRDRTQNYYPARRLP